MKRLSSKKAFTIFEVLIIIVIVAVVFTILYHILRQKHRADMLENFQTREREFIEALDKYFNDYNSYPPPASATGAFIQSGTDGFSIGYPPLILTTPMSYMKKLPRDPFYFEKEVYEDIPYGPYRYATDGTDSWIIISIGPDLKQDIILENMDMVKQYLDRDTPEYQKEIFNYTFDPTNGSTSPGDTWRAGP